MPRAGIFPRPFFLARGGLNFRGQKADNLHNSSAFGQEKGDSVKLRIPSVYAVI
jgi:hypothetical protein